MRSSWPPAPTGSRMTHPRRGPRTSRRKRLQPRRTRLRQRTNDPLDAHVPERTCVLTRRSAPREELIRLALSPDGEVAADIRARAPGRGAWIGVGRAELDSAQAKGKLRGALNRAFKAGDVQVPDD